MKAEIIFTGTELLLGQILNTNAQYLQQNLAALGIDLYYQVTVGDNQKRLVKAINQASERADLVIIGGGLGPTEDDISREALAEALGLELKENPAALEITERFFKARGKKMPPNNLKQALAPEAGIILDNPVGTAPGLAIEHNSVLYVLVPGPPGEFKTMVENQVIPLLRQKYGAGLNVIRSRVLKVCGVGEGLVDYTLGDLLRSDNPTLAPTAKFYEVHLRITAKAPDIREADRMIDGMETKVRSLLGHSIYGQDEDTLAAVVGRLLKDRRLTVAAAEICSGGYLSHLLTSHPDCGYYFKFAAVSDMKSMAGFLNTENTTGDKAVEEIAQSIRKLASADIGISIAGTDGGLFPQSKRDIIIATSFKDQTFTSVNKLWGNGPERRERAVQVCLALLWKTLTKT